jgi:type IV pilus assembly protein PilW
MSLGRALGEHRAARHAGWRMLGLSRAKGGYRGARRGASFVTPAGPRRRLAMAGFTLIEMMVALAIGLAVVGALIAAYLSSFASGRHSDALVQITEDATLALNVMRQQVAQAGFSQPHGVGPAGGLVLHTFPAVAGCEASSFADLQASILAPANCQPTSPDQSTPDALEVAYEGSLLPAGSSNGILGGPGTPQPLDCLGNTFAKTHDDATGDDYWLNDSKFYVADNSLYCHGPGNRAGAAIVQNVETLQVTYGMAAAPLGAPGAGQVLYYDDAPHPGSPLWANVVSVKLCVQVRSATKVLDKASAATLGSWIDCRNAPRTSTDGYLRRTFTTTIVLQNKLL